MKPWEQRVTGWVGLVLVAFSTWFLWQLEKNRFQNPFAADVGVEWEKSRVVGGVNTVPVQYTDVLTLTNSSDRNLDNVEIAVSNWNAASEVIT